MPSADSLTLKLKLRNGGCYGRDVRHADRPVNVRGYAHLLKDIP